MRVVLFHPLGLALLCASLVLSGAMRFLPGLDRWSAQAPWALFWGLLGYTTSVVALLWSGAGLEGLSSTGQSAEADLSGKAINKRLRAEAVRHPGTLLPICVTVASAGYRLLLAADAGGGLWATVALALSGAAAAGSFSWLQIFRHTQRYERLVQELMAIQDRERAGLDQAGLEGLREKLKAGLGAVGSAQAAKAFRDLDEEYTQLQPVLVRRDTDPLSIALAPALATETYRRGLSVLADALELMEAVQGRNKEQLQKEIAGLEREVDSSKDNETQRTRMEIRQERLASHRQRLAMMDQLQVHIDQLLNQADRCEASLHRTRIELASLRAGASKTSVDSVIEALQETIRRAKEVQEELRKLGI